MCSFIANLTIEAGYKVTVNKRGTLASGYAEMAEDTKMGLRGTYQFRDNYEVQVRKLPFLPTTFYLSRDLLLRIQVHGFH
jgi:hypothetical protein